MMRILSRIGITALLSIVFLRELVKSSISVAKAAFAREPQTKSAILAMPLELQSDLGIAVLANLITLTPGTCTLHISDDRKQLFLHALDVEDVDALIAETKQVFEAPLRRLER